MHGCICTSKLAWNFASRKVSHYPGLILGAGSPRSCEIQTSAPLSPTEAALRSCVITERSLPWSTAKGCSWRRSHFNFSLLLCRDIILGSVAVSAKAALLSGKKIQLQGDDPGERRAQGGQDGEGSVPIHGAAGAAGSFSIVGASLERLPVGLKQTRRTRPALWIVGRSAPNPARDRQL